MVFEDKESKKKKPPATRSELEQRSAVWVRWVAGFCGMGVFCFRPRRTIIIALILLMKVLTLVQLIVVVVTGPATALVCALVCAVAATHSSFIPRTLCTGDWLIFG